MLKKWQLKNFKSVRSLPELELGPITVFVGANSSGKSTLIQSILLIKQTLTYAPADRPVALNGPLLKLGNFLDIESVKSKDNYIEVGWEYDRDYLTSQLNLPSSIPTFGVRNRLSRYAEEANKIGCNFRFEVRDRKSADELYLLQPTLLSSSLSVMVTPKESSESKENYVKVERAKRSVIEKSNSYGVISDQNTAYDSALGFDVVKIDSDSESQICEDKPDSKLIGAWLRHFFPYYVAISYDEAKRKARRIAELICSPTKYVSDSAEQLLEHPVNRTTIDMIFKYLESVAKKSEGKIEIETRSIEHIKTVKELREEISTAVRQRGIRTRNVRGRMFRPFLPIALDDLQSRIEESLLNLIHPSTEIDFGSSRNITSAAYWMREYFVEYVKYLGPLRDEPKPLYPLEALTNPTDVGYRGEHTAAVLDLHKDRRVEYIPSRIFVGPLTTGGAESATLHDAVVDWLSYMGVLEDVTTGDRGKFGHELQVRTAEVEKLHDLTNVGVGVSQVLPIVVMALLAESGSLLIFEQPELHLHPLVQTRLADFFASLALFGKQCIVETHSEYMVYRMRRRIAEADNDSLVNLCRIYFVERKSGESICRQVRVTEFGAIADWPADFFDQSQSETERIILAASKKRDEQIRRIRKLKS